MGKQKQMTVAELAERCADAYSTDRYRNGWSGCIRMLRGRGYDDRQIEAILRSKWTRWAADQSGQPYGRVTSAALRDFLDGMKRERQQVVELTAETFAGTDDDVRFA